MKACFVGSLDDRALADRVRRAGFSLVSAAPGESLEKDLETTLTAAPSDCVVVDGYRFDRKYLSTLAATGRRLVVIDDMARLSEYRADIIVNQNIGAEALVYNAPPGARRMLGVNYFLLRPEFVDWRGWQRPPATIGKRVLVTLGGSDVAQNFATVIAAISLIPGGLDIRMILPLATVPHAELDAACAAAIANGHSVSPEQFSEEMPQLLMWADVVVSGAGTTCGELAFMQAPAVLLVLADNQNANAIGMAKAGAAINLGRREAASAAQIASALERLLRDPGARDRMAGAGRELVDGDGAKRVARAMAEILR